MKPEKLIMQGFGPYLGITEVDFTRLGENSLFLITGATGGGQNDDSGRYLFCPFRTGNRRPAQLEADAQHRRAG